MWQSSMPLVINGMEKSQVRLGEMEVLQEKGFSRMWIQRQTSPRGHRSRDVEEGCIHAPVWGRAFLGRKTTAKKPRTQEYHRFPGKEEARALEQRGRGKSDVGIALSEFATSQRFNPLALLKIQLFCVPVHLSLALSACFSTPAPLPMHVYVSCLQAEHKVISATRNYNEQLN